MVSGGSALLRNLAEAQHRNVMISRRLCLILLALLSAIPCAVPAEPTVALMTELSGSFAENGADCRKGYELAVAGFAGDKAPRVIYGDTQGDPKIALSEMQRFLDLEKASIIVANRSQVGMALGAACERRGIPFVGVVGHSDFVARYRTVVRAWPDTSAEAAVLAKTALSLGHRRITPVTLEDEYLTSLTEKLNEALRQLGGELTPGFTVMPGETDFRTLAAQIQREAPPALFVNLGIPQLGPFYRHLAELRLRMPTYSNYWLQKPEVLKAAGDAAEGAVFVEALLDLPKLRGLFRQHFGEPANLMMSYTCYTGALLALTSAGRTPAESLSRLMVRDFLDTPDGRLPIINREIRFPLEPKKIMNGRAVPLSGP